MEPGVVDVFEWIEPLFERIEHQGIVPESEAALHEVLDKMACKAAIKAGDVLSDDRRDESAHHWKVSRCLHRCHAVG
ncbi:MAG: hypothetical protein CMJ35_09730 [Phycisphaerae bacterium]|nr:hypothetical protein [Phycisphaerae bacterium]MBM91874.1 hypothetical protein [Phycisphaerae bacterium]